MELLIVGVLVGVAAVAVFVHVRRGLSGKSTGCHCDTSNCAIADECEEANRAPRS
ncbi:MAG: hypothetical protein GY851_11985 [bacterium]|nr:hypothetical protein [bacterium]